MASLTNVVIDLSGMQATTDYTPLKTLGLSTTLQNIELKLNNQTGFKYSFVS